MRHSHLILLFSLVLLADPTGYYLAGKYTIGGPAAWDYINIDPAARRLYVTHLTQIEVLDADTGHKMGAIMGLSGVHGIALVPELGKGFASNGETDTVSVIDLKTLQHVAEIKAGKKPDAIVYDPGTKQVIVSNGESENITVIDAASAKVTGTITIGSGPEYIVSDGKGTIWVNLEDKDAYVTVDLNGKELKKTTPLAGCKGPSAMAIDRATRRLFIGCANNTGLVVEADSGGIVSKVAIGAHVDAATFDTAAGLAFFSTGDGKITVVKETSPGRYAVTDTIATKRGAKTMVLDNKTKKIFLPTAEGVPTTATGPPKPSGPGAYKAGEFVVLVVSK